MDKSDYRLDPMDKLQDYLDLDIAARLLAGERKAHKEEIDNYRTALEGAITEADLAEGLDAAWRSGQQGRDEALATLRADNERYRAALVEIQLVDVSIENHAGVVCGIANRALEEDDAKA